jgi:ribosome-associated toxin RatA of RatAB toxin-antitoxin module
MSQAIGLRTRCGAWQACLPRFIVIAAAALGSASAIGADDLVVQAKRAGHAVAVEARATLKAPPELIWATLTDYDHLAEFIPGLRTSRLIGRRGPAAIVEQHGEAGFFIFSYGIDVTVESAEYPPNLIRIHVISGNLRQLDGAYKLAPGEREGTWLLTWSGVIEPSLPVPSFVAVSLMRSNVKAQFSGMVDEIERRWVQSGTIRSDYANAQKNWR